LGGATAKTHTTASHELSRYDKTICVPKHVSEIEGIYMEQTLIYSRLQFAFTIAFHYLYPQLTMGLTLFILYFKTRYLIARDERYDATANFWIKILAITFVFGIVTGIPMEFQFGTNWADFSAYAGGVIGQTLAMEGIFSFFLESTFLGVLLVGKRKFGLKMQWFASLMVFLGSWLSAYFILATNAWMQHPIAYSTAVEGSLHVNNLWSLLTNTWLLWQFLHNQSASIITTSFVIAGVGAFYLLSKRHQPLAQIFLRTALIAALAASIFQIFPTGDGEARQIFESQPIKGAAMEGLFKTERGAGISLFGQPNMQTETLDNPIVIPDALSLLAYHRMLATVKGLDAFPKADWPNVPLVYYAYHIMVTLGFMFAGITMMSTFLLWRKKLYETRWMLWIWMLSAPLPYVATLAGWITTEVGRQPWLVYGLLKTEQGVTSNLSAGNAMFSLLGFIGIYLVAGLLYLLLIFKTISRGPESHDVLEKLNPTGSSQHA
jgi:cytochrome d ubiquinol oxidase subunit I